MISFQEARESVLARARSFGSEEVELGSAAGRVLAEPVRADRDYPPFNRATMDGYALRYEDLERGIRRFRVVEILFAGAQPGSRADSGECYKIMTGAAVPEGADIVIRREDVQEGAKEMEVSAKDPEPWRPYLNIARQGEDMRGGDLVIDKPCQCTPAVMGMLATLGRTNVSVARNPQVAVITTGDEVISPGVPVSRVHIRNSNEYMLKAALQREGIGLSGGGHSSDHPESLTELLKPFLTQDILITTGGVSAGDADYIPRILEELGVKRLFHKIAMRPGKPGYCGLLPGGGVVFGLPGNPFSCHVHFTLLIRPFVLACWGLEPPLPVGVPLAGGRNKRSPLDEFFPVYVGGSPIAATAVALNGSGDIRLGMQANALALHPAGAGDLAAGSNVGCYWL